MVTVLMPAYNAGPYIAEAIDSILNQTFTDFEFLIINDGSKDDSLSIIRSYNDPRIVVIDQANRGLIDSLNYGISIARGELIARMDADDVCMPERLAVQVQFLNDNQEYILAGATSDVMDKDGNYLMHLEPSAYSHEEIVKGIDGRCPFIHPCVIFRKDAVIKAGGYPKHALTFEDHMLWKRMLSIGKVCNLRQMLVKVRFNPESVTIDEKWRGPLFVEIRRRSVASGQVSEEDALKLKELISSQNFGTYKQASYYAMIGKKYLWNNPDKKLARQHFRKAIKLYPKNKTLYLLFLLSFLPSALVTKLYSKLKG